MRLPYLFFALLLLGGLYTCSGSEQTVKEPLTVIQLFALQEFTLPEKAGYAPAYRHTEKNALAINAAEYKNQYAIAEYVFKGEHGVYDVEITSLQETDGESTYKLFVDDKLVATATNDPTTVDYQPQLHKLGKVNIRPGQRISIAFNSHSNRKIPEDGGFAFSRGRWTGVTLSLHRRM